LIQKALVDCHGLAKICWAVRLVSINEQAVFDSKSILLKMNGLENKRQFNVNYANKKPKGLSGEYQVAGADGAGSSADTSHGFLSAVALLSTLRVLTQFYESRPA
jgi:hypothetical protein